MNKKAAIEARRTHIVGAALSCFLEKGYNQTGIRDIARKAEISLGNLYNHFASKQSVLIEIARLEQEELDGFIAQLSDHGDPTETFRTFLDDYTRYCCQSDYVVLTIEIIGEAIRDKEVADLFAANRSRLVDALVDLLSSGEATGHFKVIAETQEMAEIILDSVESYAMRLVLGMKTPESGADFLHQFLLNGVRS